MTALLASLLPNMWANGWDWRLLCRLTGKSVPLIGKEVGDFKVEAFAGGDFRDVTKADLMGKWSVFVIRQILRLFVPPSWATWQIKEFKKICCEIYSVSADTHFVYKVWPDVSDTVKKIRYSMFADPTARAGFRGLRREGVAVINPEAKLVS
jgi:peroxiredoxin (alkyl hydroperoxide reductase subunit C)